MTPDEASSVLLAAEANRTAIEPLSGAWPELDADLGLAVQATSLAERLRRGETLTGLKLGLTSRAKQQRMGIDTPITALLTDAMSLRQTEPLDLDLLIHARAEPEIVFVMGADLKGPGVTVTQAMAAVATVTAGVEIIDSRYKDFRFSLGDVIADNASAARYVLGPISRHPATLDLSLEACVVELDGRVVDSATGASVQGHPGEALAAAANALAATGTTIKAGWTVLTGGMTDAVELGPSSTLRVDFSHLGSIVVQAFSSRSGGATS